MLEPFSRRLKMHLVLATIAVGLWQWPISVLNFIFFLLIDPRPPWNWATPDRDRRHGLHLRHRALDIPGILQAISKTSDGHAS